MHLVRERRGGGAAASGDSGRQVGGASAVDGASETVRGRTSGASAGALSQSLPGGRRVARGAEPGPAGIGRECAEGARRMKTVFFDVDTQIDFMYPAGALYVPGAENVVGEIAALKRFADSQGIPLVSTMDAHSEDDPEFRVWPPHCVVGTAGQLKPEATL